MEGKSNSKSGKAKKGLIGCSVIVLAFFIIIVIIGLVAGGNNNSEQVPTSTASADTNSDTAEQTPEEYSAMLTEYDTLFKDAMSPLADTSITDAIANSDLEALQTAVQKQLEILPEKEKMLEDKFNEVDQHRDQPPYGTKIMTLMNSARSALRTYTMACEYVNDYLTTGEQENLESASEYLDKTAETITEYTEILAEEQENINSNE